jgi:Iap family predicted aminopeptidase
VAAFLWAGIPAASLEVSGSTRAEQAYHTVNDTMDKVDQSALEMTVQTVMDVIRQMDSDAEAL